MTPTAAQRAVLSEQAQSTDTGAVAGLPSPGQVADMQQHGYLVVRQFLSRAQLQAVLEWTGELERAPEVSGRHWVYHEDSLTRPGQRLIQRIENFCPFHAKFDGFVRSAAVLGWVGALMGGPVVLFKDKINCKLPGGDGFKAHQDQQAGWSAYGPLFVTMMLTLDAATLENGCLEIGSRREAGLIGEEWQPLDAGGLELRPVPTAPGDAIFFDSYAPHASQPNLTSSPRRVLYLTYNLLRDGDHRARYFADKHASFPPDIDRRGDRKYVYRV